MNFHNEQLADKVIAAFKEVLSEQSRAQLTDAEYNALAQIVRAALSRELTDAVEMIDQVAKRLRAMTEHQDIDL